MTLLAIAHRAGNDLDTLRTAVELGADVLEADVHVRAARLEVRHSKHLRPLPLLWDTGPTGRLELTRTSPTALELDAVLSAAGTTTPVMLDLKGPGRVGVRVAELLHARSPQVPLLVCSRWWLGLAPFAALPEVRVVMTARNAAELRRLLRRVRTSPPFGVSVHRSLLTGEAVRALRAHVEVVMTWGVNDPGVLREVVDHGVNGIISDSPDVLRSVLARR